MEILTAFLGAISRGVGLSELILYLIVILILGWLGIVQFKISPKKKKKDQEKREVQLKQHILTAHQNIVDEIRELLREELKIVYRKTLNAQMHLWDDLLNIITRTLQDAYSEALKARGYPIHELSTSFPIKHWRAITKIIQTRWRETLESMMIENGLPKKSNAEMQVYIDNKVPVFIDILKDVLEAYYGSTEMPLHLDELLSLLSGHKDVLRAKFVAVLSDCRQIAIEDDTRIEEIESRLLALRSTPCYMKEV